MLKKTGRQHIYLQLSRTIIQELELFVLEAVSSGLTNPDIPHLGTSSLELPGCPSAT